MIIKTFRIQKRKFLNRAKEYIEKMINDDNLICCFEKFDAECTRMPFGKYKGEMIRTIMRSNPSYTKWLLGIETKGALHSALLTLRDDIINSYEIHRVAEDDNDADALSGYPYWY